LLAHVIDTAKAAALEPIVVVVPAGPEVRAEVGGAATIIENPDPGQGLSSSVRIGFEALADAPVEIGAAVVLLADQPLVPADVISRLVASGDPRPFLVATYDDGTNPNPVLVRRESWWVAGELRGDRGFGAWMAANRRYVAEVRVAGSNPDVDTTADLDRLQAGRAVVGEA
jgi:molybdenum cofactor cytidylyltransferase